MCNRNIERINFLSGNQLKLLALFAMTCDHVGKQLLPQYAILQIIGRLAFPIFAYMIAEGCRYTQNRRRYLLTMAALALVCQMVYGLAMGSLYQCVLVTFSMAITGIYVYDYLIRKRTLGALAVAGMVLGILIFACVRLPGILTHTDFAIDYGIWGVLLPVLIYVSKDKKRQLAATAIGLMFLSISLGGIQWYSLCAVPILCLYSGKRGKKKMKNLFYIYYPLHLVCIYVIGMLD